MTVCIGKAWEIVIVLVNVGKRVEENVAMACDGSFFAIK